MKEGEVEIGVVDHCVKVKLTRNQHKLIKDIYSELTANPNFRVHIMDNSIWIGTKDDHVRLVMVEFRDWRD